MSMQRIGEVVRTAQGLAVVRSPDDGHPDFGTTVVDENLDEVVFDNVLKKGHQSGNTENI